VASGTVLDNLNRQSVKVAVGNNIYNVLVVSRRFALAPQAFAGTGIEARFAFLHADFKTFPIHVGNSKHLFGVKISNHAND
jgi:hypothetical protein